MLRSTSTPDTVESRLGTLEFTDGARTKATAELVYDHPQRIEGVYNTGGGPHFGSGLTINTAAGLYETGE
jgi:hypothetical protein